MIFASVNGFYIFFDIIFNIFSYFFDSYPCIINMFFDIKMNLILFLSQLQK